MLISRQAGISALVLLLLIAGLAGISATAVWVATENKSSTTQDQHSASNNPPPDQQGAMPSATPHRSNSSYQEKPATADLQPSGLPDDDSSAPVTSIDLTLKGIISRSDPSLSRALIAKGSEPEQSYLPGAGILANVHLDSVEDDHVVLQVNGRKETLYINRTLKGGSEGIHRFGQYDGRRLDAANRRNPNAAHPHGLSDLASGHPDSDGAGIRAANRQASTADPTTHALSENNDTQDTVQDDKTYDEGNDAEEDEDDWDDEDWDDEEEDDWDDEDWDEDEE